MRPKVDSYHRLALSLIACYFLGLAAVSWYFPRSNWDMVAYVATTIERNGIDKAALHKLSWDAVRDRVSQGEFVVLTSDRPYRIEQYQSPNSFASILPFYKIKFLYVETATILTKYLQPVDALRMISTLSICSIAAVVTLWMRGWESFLPKILAIPLISLCSVGYVGQYISPDLMASALLMAGILLWMKGLGTTGGLLLIMGVLTRPDHLVLLFNIAAISSFWGLSKSSQNWVIALVGFAGCLAVASWAAHPGWWVHFSFASIEIVNSIDGYNPPFSISKYVIALIHGGVRSVVAENWPSIFLIEVCAIYIMRGHLLQIPDRMRCMLLALVATVPIKFVIAPMFETRFYVAYLLCIGMIVLEYSNSGRPKPSTIDQAV